MTPAPIARTSATTIDDLVAREGSASAAHATALARSDAAPRDLADAVHALCTVHGVQPGLIELAVDRASGPLADWTATAAELFAHERAFLARLAAALGPLPSTPGHAQAEAALGGQRHALDMLARSDRDGCALGAAVALVADWRAVRPVLIQAAIRSGIEPPDWAGIASPAPPASEAIRRAWTFGARQLVVQQRGLWQLLEDRAAARNHQH